MTCCVKVLGGASCGADATEEVPRIQTVAAPGRDGAMGLREITERGTCRICKYHADQVNRRGILYTSMDERIIGHLAVK